MLSRKQRVEVVVALGMFLAALAARADTFTNTKDGRIVKGTLLGTGFKEGRVEFLVRKEDGSRVVLPSGEWERAIEPGKEEGAAKPKPEAGGPSVCFIQVEVPLDAGRATDLIVSAIRATAKDKPVAVVFEIDTPGGRVDFAQEICRAIEELKDTKKVAFVKGGKYRGAFSAGALIAMACDAIYMAEGSSIGAAAPFVAGQGGPQFTEKMTSAFSATFRAVAEKHRRPTAVAAAMVDPDVEVREVMVAGKRQFEPGDRAQELAAQGAELGRWVNRKGKLLTLTAGEAKELGIADGVANTRKDLLKVLGAEGSRVVDLATTESIRRRLAEDRKLAVELAQSAVREWTGLQASDPGNRFDPAAARRCLTHIDRCLSLFAQLLKIAEEQPAALGDDDPDRTHKELAEEVGGLRVRREQLLARYGKR